MSAESLSTLLRQPVIRSAGGHEPKTRYHQAETLHRPSKCTRSSSYVLGSQSRDSRFICKAYSSFTFIRLDWPSQTESPDNPPDLVISADTIVLLPGETDDEPATILEKPGSKANNLKMLQDQNGRTVKCITGVNVVFPTLHNPGYAIQ